MKRTTETMSAKLEKIKGLAERILDEIGIRIYHPEMLQVLADKGVRVKGDTACFTRDQIHELVAIAPETFTLHAPNPDYDADQDLMDIGNDQG